MRHRTSISRRRFGAQCSLAGLGAFFSTRALLVDAAQISTDAALPNITSGVASGDVSRDAAIIWSRADRPSRMVVDVATSESFQNKRRVVGPDALASQDYCVKLRLAGLPAGQRMFYQVRFQDLDDPRKLSAPVAGQFVTAPADFRNISFVWSGDTAGQGFGIDVARGGMATYETMRKLSPNFFVHSGDTIYADNPFSPELRLPDGSTWKNVVTEQTSKVAETLEEFRAKFLYNLLDDNVRRFNAEVPMFAQWDDHEVLNNWYPGEQLLKDDRYRVKSVSLLASRARQAFFECLPIRTRADAHQRVFRSVDYGPLLELFFIDLRSYRGPNSANRQEEMGPETAFLGPEQLQWLKRRLFNSQATWKVICSDMPIGLLVRDGPGAFENGANGNGPPLGRELEVASLLAFIKTGRIKNVVWLTADVHYAASHHYNPNRARFQDFEAFWEFVSGPLHAGTFGPGELDDTFGPEVKYCSVEKGMRQGRPPSDGLQFFGLVRIDGQSRIMTVTHLNVAGDRLWSVELDPHTGSG